MTWESRQRRVEDATESDLGNYLYDWDCGMRNAFNGTPYPTDYPRCKLSVSSYTLDGGHLCFNQFQKYCNDRGIYE